MSRLILIPVVAFVLAFATTAKADHCSAGNCGVAARGLGPGAVHSRPQAAAAGLWSRVREAVDGPVDTSH